MESERPITIYALLDPDTKEVRYIGKAVNLRIRLQGHLYQEPGKRTPRTVWVQSLREMGKHPEVMILEETSSSQAREMEYKWIQHYREEGCALTNLRNPINNHYLEGYSWRQDTWPWPTKQERKGKR